MGKGRVWLVAVLAWALAGAPRCGAQNAGAGTASDTKARRPWTVVVAASGDGGEDRYGTVTLERGDWRLQNINWTNPDVQSALSAVLAGRRVRPARWVEAVVLAGPWYSYDSHSWEEMVVATHFTFRRGHMTVASANYWGAPVRRTGAFFDAHVETVSGLPYLPSWVGVSALEKHEHGGLARLFVGPVFTRTRQGVTVSANPYWDAGRRTFDVKLGVSYRREIGGEESGR